MAECCVSHSSCCSLGVEPRDAKKSCVGLGIGVQLNAVSDIAEHSPLGSGLHSKYREGSLHLRVCYDKLINHWIEHVLLNSEQTQFHAQYPVGLPALARMRQGMRYCHG